MAAAAADAAGVAELDETLEMKDFITKSSGGDVAATSSPNLPLHDDVCVCVLCVCVACLTHLTASGDRIIPWFLVTSH